MMINIKYNCNKPSQAKRFIIFFIKNYVYLLIKIKYIYLKDFSYKIIYSFKLISNLILIFINHKIMFIKGLMYERKYNN